MLVEMVVVYIRTYIVVAVLHCVSGAWHVAVFNALLILAYDTPTY